MKTYTITITENTVKRITIQADSAQDASEKAEEMYYLDKIDIKKDLDDFFIDIFVEENRGAEENKQ